MCMGELTPTERPACSEAGGVGSNPGLEAPWSEPVSRSASEPNTASLYNPRAANHSGLPKPATHREATFTSSGGALRGKRGQRTGKEGLGRLGGPWHRPRAEGGKTCAESIRRALVAGESERLIVALRARSSREGAKGPWPYNMNSGAGAADWSNPTTADEHRAESAVAGGG